MQSSSNVLAQSIKKKFVDKKESNFFFFRSFKYIFGLPSEQYIFVINAVSILITGKWNESSSTM